MSEAHQDNLKQLSTAQLLIRQRELENEVRELRRAVLAARERADASIERLESQVAQLQSRTARLDRLIRSVLQSRIWQTLVGAGSVVLRMQSLAARLSGRRSPTFSPSGTEFFELTCDRTGGGTQSAYGLSGTVLLRGWALTAAPVTRVELLAGDTVTEARCDLYRPDILKLYPAFPHAERCGWQAHLDTTALPNGLQQVRVRAVTAAGMQNEIEVPLWIDHGAGYASDYYRWIAEFEKRDPDLIGLKIVSFERKPLVSVVVPVYRTSIPILEKTIDSVLRQSYPHWELCIADDGSQSPDIDALLARVSAAEPRIKTVRLAASGGISAASNAALALASGEFVALLDHDDELAEDALFHFVEAMNRNPDAEIFYSDEDHTDETGFRSDPFFKPDWSPDLILAENYVCHLMVFRRDLCLNTGGFRSEYDLSQDHDLLLRMSRSARRIVHIPRVLYHWRTEVYTNDRASSQQERALDSSRRAVEDHLRALGLSATVESGAVPSRWRVRYPIPAGRHVQIIMPCGGKVEILRRCVKSITENTDYPHYSIVVVDNSRAGQVEQFVRLFDGGGRRLGYIDFRDRPFNFSAMNNAAAHGCEAPLLLFLNDDITVITPGWLTAMVELASRPEVGAVGAKLLYPDGHIQHAGVVLGLLGVCGHGFKGTPGQDRVYFDFPDVVRNVSAVTGACMMVPTRLFHECGGFDVEALPVAYQDIDLCLKLSHKGYRVLYTPHAQLYHHEAISKRPEDKDPRPAETLVFKTRWKDAIEQDPFYSPNLTRTAEDYGCRSKSFGEAIET